MKEILNLYLNWRTYVLMALAAVALVLITGDTASTLWLVMSKLTGIALACGTCCLAGHWISTGKMNLTLEED